MAESNVSILACVDFSDATDAVIETTARLALALQSSVTLLHVCPDEPEFVTYDPGPEYIRMDFAEHCKAAHRKVQNIQGKLIGRGIDAEPLVVQGVAVEKIIEKADHFDADFIVMGSHGHGALYKLIVGSVAEGVLRKGARPVVIVPSKR